MIHVIVKHSLSEAGKKYFSEWVNELHSLASKHEGFIEVKVIKDLQEKDSSVLLLEMDNMNHLQQWRTSADHDKILSKLHPFRQGGSTMQTFEW
ncbi:antibiotic biosynthesis monooxygenase [Aquimarina sp. U1-2]|uniref:antibiotic biosynthesis monooxygenase n=1 Tax=Aquimarina sp. U1-2 TaxID=2823141 RepID=UPI001AECE3AD|nr:antibiotic biosynthesis monooxygenase [Aquimarina sp. U1-2]MBP2831227.1 antibiotic biosynthesis monooxygenase [Aquimarina sp. U1-2]